MKACGWGTVPPLHRGQIVALRAVAETPGGLRIDAYPVAMPALAAMGLVEARKARRIRGRREGQAWFFTRLGRRAYRAYCQEDVE